MLTTNPRPTYTHRRDLYYVQTRVRSRQTTRVYYREIIVDQWDWLFSYRWGQWRRFDKVKGFRILRERDEYPATLVDMVNPFPATATSPEVDVLADFVCESKIPWRYIPRPEDFDLGDA